MARQQKLPAGLVIEQAMGGQDGFGLIGVGARHRLGELAFQDGLQAEKQGIRIGSAAGFDVRKNVLRPLRILGEVAGLVTIGIENGIDHHAAPRKCSRMKKWSSNRCSRRRRTSAKGIHFARTASSEPRTAGRSPLMNSK